MFSENTQLILTHIENSDKEKVLEVMNKPDFNHQLEQEKLAALGIDLADLDESIEHAKTLKELNEETPVVQFLRMSIEQMFDANLSYAQINAMGFYKSVLIKYLD